MEKIHYNLRKSKYKCLLLEILTWGSEKSEVWNLGSLIVPSNIFHTGKILMSACTVVSKFGSPVSYKQVLAQSSPQMENVDAKFWTKGVNRSAEDSHVCLCLDIVLFTTNWYFSFIEAVSLELTLTVQ